VPGRLRRSLRASVAEGVVAEWVMACSGGAIITGWALYLGCGPLGLALLGALPFLAQLMQLPGAWLTTRLGSRTAALATVAVSRQAFLPLVALPFVPLPLEDQRAVLVAAAALHHGAGILCNNAWVTWMGDLVPRRIRGRYFGRRTAISTLAGALAALAAGTFLDGARASERTGHGLAALALAACVLGAVSTGLMALKHDPARGPRVMGFSAARILQPLRDAAARRFLAYGATWNAALGLSGPFFTLFLLEDLKLGFKWVALQTATIALARMLAAPHWGRLIDRVGTRPVLRACSAGLVLSPFLWVLAGPEHRWPIALDAVLSGVLLSGHGLAAFALPLAVAPSRERPFYHAAFSMTGGAAYALASAAGGALMQSLPRTLLVGGHAWGTLQAIFLAAAGARACAALLSRHLAERSSLPSPAWSPTRPVVPSPAGAGAPAPLPAVLARPAPPPSPPAP
jgi:MFS family permease